MDRLWRSLAMVLLLAVVPAVFNLNLSAQSTSAPAWDQRTLEQLRQLQHTALQDDYAYQQAAHLCDNIGPRPTGSLQAAAAVDYVASEMRKLGLEVTLEKVTVPKWIRGEEHAELISYPGQVPGTTQKIVLTALASLDVATPPQGITAEIVVVNNFREFENLPREKVAGKIVVFNERFDRQMEAAGFAGAAYGEAVEYRERARLLAAEKGAVAALIRSVGGAECRLPHTGETGYSPKLPAIPAGAATAEDAALMGRLSAQGPVRMHLLLTSKVEMNAESYNVIADLKGSEHPEQVVIVSGHLDSWDLGTGAIDDAAGVAVSMETAQLLKQLGFQPKRTIRIIAWMGEETGIWGGRAYAKQHAREIGDHFAGIETDLGAGHPMGIYINGDKSIEQTLAPIGEVLQDSGAGLLETSDHTGADLIPMNVMGMPSLSPIQDARTYFNYHHTAADTLDKIDPQQLRENATVVAVLAYALGSMTQPLPQKKQPVPEWLK